MFLAALAGFTGAARLPIGPVWGDPVTSAQFLAACREIEAVARAEGVAVAADVVDRIVPYVDAIPGSMRSSLLIDLQQGKRIEVEALQGSVVRRGAALGVPTPIMSTLYAVLKPHAAGARRRPASPRLTLNWCHEEADCRVRAAVGRVPGAQGKEEDRLRACARCSRRSLGDSRRHSKGPARQGRVRDRVSRASRSSRWASAAATAAARSPAGPARSSRGRGARRR